MSLPDLDRRIDQLFRESLQSERQALPPDAAWRKIEQALSPVSSRVGIRGGLGRLRCEWIRLQMRLRRHRERVPVGPGAVAWAHGISVIHPSFMGSPFVLEPELDFVPFVSDILAKPILDLRLTFRPLILNIN